MKKLLVLAAFLQIAAISDAQPWIKDDGQPKKLQDIVDAYKASNPGPDAEENEEFENGKAIKEGPNYHFDRWQWYWQNHLDENGYIVSPVKTMREWLKYKGEHSRSQAKGTNSNNASNWTFQGPDKSPGSGEGVGRINVVSFHPTDTNTFWIGSAGGGAWKTTDAGLTWTAINDHLPVLGVCDIDFNPLNPNTVYLCTGDRDASDNYSVGVLKTYDGGITWDTTGLKWDSNLGRQTNSLVINRIDTNAITLASSDGMYQSYDGGANWIKTLPGNFKQVVANPADTAILYAAGNPPGSYQLYRSTDGGATWTQTSSFPPNSRVVCAVTASDPAIVKAVVANNSSGLEGVYNSTDTGKTFTKIFSDGTNCSSNILANSPSGNVCGGQGWYDLTLAISPLSADTVVVGGVNTWHSNDGGHTFNISSQWSNFLPATRVVHADKHFHAFSPLKPNLLIECNDGGVYKTLLQSANVWIDITNGLGITQFYRIATTDKAPYVIGGAQDNGSKRVNSGTYTGLTGGDGMDCAIEFTNPQFMYTTSQNGTPIYRSSNSGGNFNNISKNIPGGQPTGLWITPMAVLPELEYLLAGYDRLYVTDDHGSIWKAISPIYSGKISRIACAPSNFNYIYLVTGNSIRYTTDYGVTWKILSLGSGLTNGTISDIHVDPFHEDHLFVTFSGYGTAKVADYAPATGWTQHNEQLPNVPVNCIQIDNLNGTLYIGTDVGVFYRNINMNVWELYSNGLPVVEVSDLDINYTTGEIWAGTYGRAMWKSPTDYFPTAVTAVPLALDVITIAPNPNNGNFEIKTDNKALIGQKANLRITSMTGAIVWQNDIDISNSGSASVHASLPRGLYTVDINKGSMLFTRTKMVVY
jgi:photosystem II stability/assembly factor-like uncharacterized protein